MAVPESETRRAAIYVRRAAASQREDLGGQIADARGIAEGLGLAVVAEYADDGYSGLSRLGERPAGRRLLADAERSRFSDVVVVRADRLGRSAEVLTDALRAIKRAGARVHGVEEAAVWPW